jgi:hypothetical protein
MKMKMKNESRTSRMKSVEVLGNNRGLGASIMIMEYDSDDDQAYCDCPEASSMIIESQTNSCLSGNNYTADCIEFRKVLIKVYERCRDEQKNKADRDACEADIETTY